MEVYSHYLRSIGFWMAFWTLLLYVVYQGFSMYSNIWLSDWSEAENTTQPEIRDLYLGVYGALGLGQGKDPLNYNFWQLLGFFKCLVRLKVQ